MFLRAMFYFESIKVFGPFIPYYDETATDNNPMIHNDKDIYENVLADVDKAIAGLRIRKKRSDVSMYGPQRD